MRDARKSRCVAYRTRRTVGARSERDVMTCAGNKASGRTVHAVRLSATARSMLQARYHKMCNSIVKAPSMLVSLSTDKCSESMIGATRKGKR